MVVDATVWISALIKSDVNHLPSEIWRQSWLRNPSRIVLPIIALAEVGGAISRRIGSPFVADRLVASLSSDPKIEIRDLDRNLGQQAARVASRYRLRGADAVYVALATDLGLPLVTWDQEILDRASDIIDLRTPNQMPI